ncbi:MAG: DEAD/DEAH box helicase family protein [Myxococcales bacterium]
MVSLSFVAGTLEVRGWPDPGPAVSGLIWDPRSQCHRAAASAFSAVVRALMHAGIPFEDHARRYGDLSTPPRAHREPRPFQLEALEAWRRAGGRGVVVLPTGAGKTHVAELAIDLARRDALVVAPTLDLVRQWHEQLGSTFRVPVGVVGGGDYELHPLTVTTYDSAYLHMENLGARFGTVVFDECHHLPSPSYVLAARACLAPFRLGLTATPERGDGRDALLTELIGPVVYRKDIVELSGDYLAEYETERITVDLSPEERAEHDAERSIYIAFLRANDIRMPAGWSRFVSLSCRGTDGPRAMTAYCRQRQLALAAPGKLDYLDHLLWVHRDGRALVFTNDNATAYTVSRRFLVPVITHQTKVRERTAILKGLADGTYGVVVTSRVLNEGVDIPDANVAIVLSGTSSVREHVQRLGRILRKREGKRAVLYELVTANTSETSSSDRRRDHSAYRSNP